MKAYFYTSIASQRSSCAQIRRPLWRAKTKFNQNLPYNNEKGYYKISNVPLGTVQIKVWNVQVRREPVLAATANAPAKSGLVTAVNLTVVEETTNR